VAKSLKELQAEIVAARSRWGFADEDVERLLVLFASEAGEMIGAVSKEHLYGRPHVPDDDKSSVRHEMADILVYMFALADLLGVDLESALASKVRLNDSRFPKK
jgi:NTP pyrophosphatase (non-canonical NTP hydrolase)